MLKYIHKLLNLLKWAKKDNQFDIDFKVNECTNGWIKINFEQILNNKNVRMVYEQIKKDESIWIGRLTKDWFRSVKYYNKGAILDYSIKLRAAQVRDLNKVKISYDHKVVIQEENSSVINSKRLLTISAILFNFSIPKSFVIIDTKMFSDLLMYMVITEPFKLDIDEINLGDYRNFQDIPNVPISNLTDMVIELTNNPIFLNRIDTLDTVGRYPNFYELRQLMINNTDSDINDLDDLQFRKVLSCLFLYNQLPIPRDYVFMDIQVIDWVKNSGIYEKAANWKSKKVKQ